METFILQTDRMVEALKDVNLYIGMAITIKQQLKKVVMPLVQVRMVTMVTELTAAMKAEREVALVVAAVCMVAIHPIEHRVLIPHVVAAVAVVM